MSKKKEVERRVQTPPKPASRGPKGDSTPKKYNLNLIFIGILILVIVVIYGRTNKYEYVSCDDTDLVVENYPFIKNLKNIPQAFRQSCFEIPNHLTDNKSYYRPVLIVSFMLDAVNSKAPNNHPRPLLFHLTNILLHILSVILLFYLLKTIGAPPFTAFILSLIFAAHPLNVQAVGWIPGRNDSLLAVFALGSFWMLLRYHKEGKPYFATLHLLFFAIALFTKESAVMLLPLFFLYYILWERDVKFFIRKPVLPVFYVLISAVWWYMRSKALAGSSGSDGFDTALSTLKENLPVILTHLGKILLPFRLSVMPGADSTNIIMGVVSLVILLVLAWTVEDKKKVVFAMLWFAFFLAPTLLVKELPAYEHRNYLPLAGLLLGISQSRLLINLKPEASKSVYALGALFAYFFVLSVMHVPTFSNRFTFWGNAAEDSPYAAAANMNLGDLYKQIENMEMARKYDLRTLEIDSTYRKANNNYGALLYLTGDKEGGANYFRKEIRLHPDNLDAYNNMGIYYREKGEPAKSVPYWEALIKKNKYYLTAYTELENFYKATGDIEKAMGYKTTREQIEAANDRHNMEIQK